MKSRYLQLAIMCVLLAMFVSCGAVELTEAEVTSDVQACFEKEYRDYTQMNITIDKREQDSEEKTEEVWGQVEAEGDASTLSCQYYAKYTYEDGMWEQKQLRFGDATIEFFAVSAFEIETAKSETASIEETPAVSVQESEAGSEQSVTEESASIESTIEVTIDNPESSAEQTADTTTVEDVSTIDFTWNGQKEVWSILPTTSADGLNWISDSMGAIMESEGYTHVTKDAQGNPTTQVMFVEDAIAAGNVGALMIAAMSVDMLEDAVERAIDAGIAVAYLGAEPINYAVSGCVYTAYEITGQWAVKAAEDWVTKRVGEGGNVPTDADGKYEVACDIYTDIIDGVYRSNGMVGTVDDSDILVRISTTSSYAGGYNAAHDNAQSVLSSNPNCHIFIAYEEEQALGINDAIADHCEEKGLNLADYCVIACYGEDSTFIDEYEVAVSNPSSSAIKGYVTYGDFAMPYGEETAAKVGVSYDAMAQFAEELQPDSAVIIPPVLTGGHLADILLYACGIMGYEFAPGYGNTYFDTVSACNIYGYENTWTMDKDNPAIQYRVSNYIG